MITGTTSEHSQKHSLSTIIAPQINKVHPWTFWLRSTVNTNFNSDCFPLHPSTLCLLLINQKFLENDVMLASYKSTRRWNEREDILFLNLFPFPKSSWRPLSPKLFLVLPLPLFPSSLSPQLQVLTCKKEMGRLSRIFIFSTNVSSSNEVNWELTVIALCGHEVLNMFL